jgi:hypothetical protein
MSLFRPHETELQQRQQFLFIETEKHLFTIKQIQ